MSYEINLNLNPALSIRWQRDRWTWWNQCKSPISSLRQFSQILLFQQYPNTIWTLMAKENTIWHIHDIISSGPAKCKRTRSWCDKTQLTNELKHSYSMLKKIEWLLKTLRISNKFWLHIMWYTSTSWVRNNHKGNLWNMLKSIKYNFMSVYINRQAHS